MDRSLLSATFVRAVQRKSRKIGDPLQPSRRSGASCRLKNRARQARISPERTSQAHRHRTCGEGV